MKRHILLVICISIVFFYAYSQSTTRDFINLKIDSIPSAKMTSDSIPRILFAKQNKSNNAKQVARSQSRMYPNSDLHPHIPNVYSIDKSTCAVGDIPYQHEINQNGSLSINIPIEKYNTPSLFDPPISLTYSSQGGSGVMSPGWNIGGLSVISQTNKSIYYDNETAGTGMKKVSNIAFSLDGLRLIKLSPELGQKIKYQTETGQIKATANLDSYGFITSFDVYFPDGSTAEYGIPDIQGAVLERFTKSNYPILKRSDVIGNTITYSYTYKSGLFFIDKIQYGKDNVAEIQFEYGERMESNSPFYYISGTKKTLQKRLTKVVTKYRNLDIRTYVIEYGHTYGSYQETVSKIQCFGSNGIDKLNPLVFYYGDENNNKEQVLKSGTDSQLMGWYVFKERKDVRTVQGKFEYGSENDGLIVLPNKCHYKEYWRKPGTSRHSRNYVENDYDQDKESKIKISAGLAGDLAMEFVEIPVGTGFVDVFCADLDEFEGDEIVKVNNFVSGNYDHLEFTVYTPNLYTGIARKYTRSFNFNTLLDHRGTKSITPKYYYSGDFLGTGKTQILAVSGANILGKGTPTVCYLFDLENNRILYQGSPFKFEPILPKYPDHSISGEDADKQSDKLLVLDHDGDGQTEICLINGEGTYFYKFNISGNLLTLLGSDSNLQKSSVAGRQILIGEVNGDGKADILVAPDKGGGMAFNFYLSRGGGTFEKKDVNIDSWAENKEFHSQDVNGDGITDIIVSKHNASTTLEVNFIKDAKVLGYKWLYNLPKEICIVPANLVSRNSYSLLGLKNDGKVTKISFSSDESKALLVTGLIDSKGVITKFNFEHLNNSYYPGTYSKGYGAKFPYKNYNGQYMVVSDVVKYYNNKSIDETTAYYTNAIVNLQGLGFRGFERISINNSNTGSVTKTYNPCEHSLPIRIETRDRIEEYEYTQTLASNKIKTVNIKSKKEKNILTGYNLNSSYVYDDFGNVLKEINDFGSGIVKETVFNYLNYNTDDRYKLGLITNRTITNKRGSSSFAFKTVMSYNNNYQAIQEVNYKNAKLVSTLEISYAPITNMVSTSRNRNYEDPNWFTTLYKYDEYGRKISEINPANVISKYEYDTRGRVSRTINDRDNITSYDYNHWGDNISITYSDGTIASTTYQWNTTEPIDALYSVTSSQTGKPSTKRYVDAFDQEIRTGVQHYDGKFLYTDKIFDNKGLLVKASLPFKTTPNQYASYSYDYNDRLLNITYPSGKKDTYSYDKSKITSVIDGVWSTQNINALGEVVSVTDISGEVIREYTADGQLASLTAPGNIQTRFEYDEVGRKIKIIDPSAGTKSYSYDPQTGYFIKETGANGKSTTLAYDNLGRVKQKTHDGLFSVNFTYNKYGDITLEEATNGTSKCYLYNERGEIIEEKEFSTDNYFLKKNYEYAGGNISTIKYETQSGIIGTEHNYYSNGVLSEIKWNGLKTIWKIVQENDQGKVVHAATGDINRYYSFDTHGMPSQRKAVYKAENKAIQDYIYVFDTKSGNLIERKDNNRIKLASEKFGYDDLNRLVSISSESISYDYKGNIISYDGIGTYQYLTSRPYALDNFLPAEASILPNENYNQYVSYNSIQRPNLITQHNFAAAFTYNSKGDRVKMHLKENNIDKLIRYYIDNQYEVDKGTNVVERLYIAGDAYNSPAVLVKTGNTWELNFILRDYLGSITHVVGEGGNLKQELSYDAWGRLRDPETQRIYTTTEQQELYLGRGYTGHEHLICFNLINMNARLYDPLVGRFLSPDPYIQNDIFSQNFNRYSYALNNPLRFTDPDGEFIHLIIGAIIGGTINVITNWKSIKGNFWKGVAYFGVGAAAGALSAGVGAGISSVLASGTFSAGFLGTASAQVAVSSFVNGAAIGAASGLSGGFTLGTSNGLLEGKSLGKSLFTGALYGGIGAVSGGVLGGALSGINAIRDGREFWNGARMTNEEILANQSLPYVQQNGNMNCGPATAEATTGVSQDTYRASIGGSAETTPVSPDQLNSAIRSETGKRSSAFVRTLPTDLKEVRQLATMMNSNNKFWLASSLSGTDIGHATALNSITVKTFTKISGDVYHKIIYQVMDPAKGTYKTIGASSMKMVYRIHP